MCDTGRASNIKHNGLRRQECGPPVAVAQSAYLLRYYVDLMGREESKRARILFRAKKREESLSASS